MNFNTAQMLKAQMTADELAYFNKGIMILGSATSSAKDGLLKLEKLISHLR